MTAANLLNKRVNMEAMMQKIEDVERMNATATVGDKIGAGFGKITAGEIADDRKAELGQAVEENIVAVDPTLPSCCIDGRTCVHTMNQTPTQPRPAVAGGALVTAYAAAEMVGWFGNDSLTPVERLARVNRVLLANGIQAGGHVDMHAIDAKFKAQDGMPKTGCGADDRLREIVMQSYENPSLVRDTSAALLGAEYDESAWTLIPKEQMTKKTADWVPTDVVEELGAATGDAVEILESDDTPTHGHLEIAVVWNNKENTTFNRDKFTEETGEQAFKVDAWYIDKLAKALATGPNAVEQYKQLKHAMVAYQVATYLTLCDGSQRLVIVN